MTELLLNFWLLFQESAPWLLLGLLVAGLMKTLVPLSLLQKHMGDNSLTSITKAAIIGAPLPLCSCGVIPAALGLRRSGASKSATTSFLVATPETGVDSISVSYALLGPFMAIIRPIAAISNAIITGLCVKWVERYENIQHSTDAVVEGHSGCQAKKEQSSCCAKKASPQSESSQQFQFIPWLKDTWQFSSEKLLNDITKWLLIGLAVAAMIKTWLPTDFLVQWGDGFMAMLIMALIGIPMYICATASTPLAAGFLAMGVSPGAVLVFMLAGPATNLSTMGMVRQELGQKIALVYVATLITVSIAIGYLTNVLLDNFGWEVYQVAGHGHHSQMSIVFPLSAIFLAALMLRNYVKRWIPAKHPIA